MPRVFCLCSACVFREVTTQLIKAGANLEAKTKKGTTALMFAAKKNNESVTDARFARGRAEAVERYQTV